MLSNSSQCPRCTKDLEQFHISFTEFIYMCMDCSFPLDSSDLDEYICTKHSNKITGKRKKRDQSMNTIESDQPLKKVAIDVSPTLEEIDTTKVDKKALNVIIEKLETCAGKITLGKYSGKCYNSLTILAHDLQCLLPRRWLHDTPIHLYFISITKKYPSFGYIPSSCYSIWSNSNSDTSSDFQMSKENILSLCEQLKEGELDSIIIPLHIVDSWVLGVISGDGNVYIYTTGGITNDIKKTANILLNWTEEQFDEIEWELNFFGEDKIGLIDGFNCTVMVAMYAEFFCKQICEPSELIDRLKGKDVNEYRMKILDTIISDFSLCFPGEHIPIEPSSNFHIDEKDLQNLSELMLTGIVNDTFLSNIS